MLVHVQGIIPEQGPRAQPCGLAKCLKPQEVATPCLHPRARRSKDRAPSSHHLSPGLVPAIPSVSSAGLRLSAALGGRVCVPPAKMHPVCESYQEQAVVTMEILLFSKLLRGKLNRDGQGDELELPLGKCGRETGGFGFVWVFFKSTCDISNFSFTADFLPWKVENTCRGIADFCQIFLVVLPHLVGLALLVPSVGSLCPLHLTGMCSWHPQIHMSSGKVLRYVRNVAGNVARSQIGKQRGCSCVTHSFPHHFYFYT